MWTVEEDQLETQWTGGPRLPREYTVEADLVLGAASERLWVRRAVHPSLAADERSGNPSCETVVERESGIGWRHVVDDRATTGLPLIPGVEVRAERQSTGWAMWIGKDDTPFEVDERTVAGAFWSSCDRRLYRIHSPGDGGSIPEGDHAGEFLAGDEVVVTGATLDGEQVSFTVEDRTLAEYAVWADELRDAATAA